MNAIWNLSILERPPYLTWQIKPLNAKKTGVDVTRFKTVLGTAICDLDSMGGLHMEATVLSRLIYRMKSKFRNDKGLRFMVKLNKALINYYNMSLKKEYMDLRSDLRMEDGTYVLPSRQRLEYILARTQGFGKLMTRIEELSRYTSHFLRTRMGLGHAWSIALVAYGTTSRIWLHARNTIKKCCKWYDELYQCAKQFQYVGAKFWLPKDQSLPHNLKSWLCLDWIETDIYTHNLQTWQKIFTEPIEMNNDSKITFITPNEEIDGSMPNEKTDDSRLTQVIEIASTNNVLRDKSTSNTDISDIGEVIDRKAFERSLPPNDSSVTTKRKHTDINERTGLKELRKKKKKKNKK